MQNLRTDLRAQFILRSSSRYVEIYPEQCISSVLKNLHFVFGNDEN